MTPEMNTATTVLIENIKKDYFEWTMGCAKGTLSEVNEEMIERFNAHLTYKVGNKYIKVFTEGGSVWGFVVNTFHDKKFAMGDILKAAGWAAPARNAARGNILDGGYTIRWTGPLYLK